MIRAVWNGVTVAEAIETSVVDGYHYFPPESVRFEYLQASPHRSVCGWKGEASYYTIVVDGRVNQDAAWVYSDPKPAADGIKGHIGFWRGVSIET
jgi:uncharacterized protein (DUF427 family)